MKEPINTVEQKHGKEFTDFLARVENRLAELEKKYKKDNPEFSISRFWGWEDFSGSPKIGATADCEPGLAKEIGSIIADEYKRLE